MSKKHTYHVETKSDCQWLELGGGYDSRGYVLGYVAAMATQTGPRLAYRAVRDDGLVASSSAARADVSIGQVAGFPTAEQYEQAGHRALEIARQIRERAKR